MRNWKWLGQGLDPAQKLGLVSCLCVTALGLPIGIVGSLAPRAQASTRTGSPNGRATNLADVSEATVLDGPSTLSPAAVQVPAPQSISGILAEQQGTLSAATLPIPAKPGSLNLDDLLDQVRQAAPTSGEEPALKIGEQQQQTSQPISTLYDYQMDGQQVVTVYVRDLPVVSFVEQPELDNPLERATSLVAQLNQIAQGSLKDTTITLDWADPKPTEQESGVPLYAIHVNEEELLRIDEGVLLVDSQRPVDTAVLAVNRLRRLLLDAPPIQAPALPQSPTLTATARQPKTGAQQEPVPAPTRVVGPVEEGIASWYDLHKTRHEMTAAHPTLPFGTEVRVTNVENGRQAIVRINDRGPFIPGRIIDVSIRAAEVLGMVRSGIAPVRVEVVQR
ncbi:septal ring lytic transglycosylase RlpA family protein [Thermostichus vulcanus]|uniref:Probable endolytic peptidoglycan transglycosylase RlpA n=1 Tax=Thermostichus vulcanus str. 'Rupite' TaxID=2813851 RepID=A0ABT0C8W3_THEVL|nr:septal ring lytic transglycosylase RlpA family protein [Thermostichus vulcanus]MCJ2542157.1 septal ring lytic transglycosylase RlpA family protein [Thermostichus vulcanus str. 'Rupite']